MQDKLKPLGMNGAVFNVADKEKFKAGLALIRDSLFDKGATLFCADNLITWNRNYSFMRDEFFGALLRDPAFNVIEKSIVWRTYILLYFARLASRAEGDFMELGCYTGGTARTVVRGIDFSALNKRYYLYDLFVWKEGDGHTKFPGHDNPNLYENVVATFAPHSFVTVTRGSVPEVLSEVAPERVAFAHIDMNHPDPEAGALAFVLPRLSPGGAVVMDDYGWWGYSAQKIALDPIISEHGLDVLELPTGQGLILKP